MGMGGFLTGLIGGYSSVALGKQQQQHNDDMADKKAKLEAYTAAVKDTSLSPEARVAAGQHIEEILAGKGKGKGVPGPFGKLLGMVHGSQPKPGEASPGQQPAAIPQEKPAPETGAVDQVSGGTAPSIPPVPSATTERAKPGIPPVPPVMGLKEIYGSAKSQEQINKEAAEIQVDTYKKQVTADMTARMQAFMHEHSVQKDWDDRLRQEFSDNFTKLTTDPKFINGTPEQQELALWQLASLYGKTPPKDSSLSGIAAVSNVTDKTGKVRVGRWDKKNEQFIEAGTGKDITAEIAEIGKPAAPRTLTPEQTFLDLNDKVTRGVATAEEKQKFDSLNKGLRKYKELTSPFMAEENVHIILERPDPATGNIPIKGLGVSPNLIYQAGQDWVFTDKLPSWGLFGGSANLVAAKRDSVLNTGAAMIAASGVDKPLLKMEYKANEKALGLVVPRYNMTMASATAAIKNVGLAVTESPSVSRTDSAWINSLMQKYQGNFTEAKELSRFEMYIYTAAREYAKVVTGGAASVQQLTDTATKEVERLLNAAKTPGGFQAVTEAMQDDMGNVTSSQLEQINAISGTVASFLAGLSGLSGGVTPPVKGRVFPVPGTGKASGTSGVNDDATKILKGIGIE